MKRFSILLPALAAAVTLALASMGRAHGGGHGGHGGSAPRTTHGAQFNPGHGRQVQRASSHARSYHGWSRYCWFPGYDCYGYYCPDDGCWYYWYGPENCYRPVSDMTGFPPDHSTAPDLPPGATQAP